jgi:hypothetical protein
MNMAVYPKDVSVVDRNEWFGSDGRTRWVSEVETHRKERDVFADRSLDDYEFDYWSGLVVEEE